ncbi:hypothetical protein RSAG8_10618, partial [Rhizoctonia solani AG-8 WAC10335]
MPHNNPVQYFINQGTRVTMRVTARASVVLVIYHLYSYKDIAIALADQITAALSSFYVSIACQTRLIHRGFTSGEAEIMFDEIPRNVPYHLAVIFLTEGDPQGGWWHTSAYGNMKDSQVSEQDFLSTCLHNLRKMACKAETARVFGVACGFNLRVNGSMQAILEYLKPTAFRSLVLPSTCSLLMCDYLPLLSELFINIYYFGAALEPSLLQIWAKSKQIRVHTGLVIVDRPDLSSEMSAKMILYAPVASRPLGVTLPLVYAVCGCSDGGGVWEFKKEVENHIETVFIYRASCCRVELQVGIHPADRRQRTDHEVRFTVEPWDISKGRFTFNESDNVRMKIFPAPPGKRGAALELNTMWTRSGKKALKREMKLRTAVE